MSWSLQVVSPTPQPAFPYANCGDGSMQVSSQLAGLLPILSSLSCICGQFRLYFKLLFDHGVSHAPEIIFLLLQEHVTRSTRNYTSL
jgi:hypothetical protein